MTRIVVLLAACLVACDVGDASNGKTVGDGGVKMDGSGSGSGVDAAPVAAHNHNAPLNAANPTNAGQGCLSVNCHGTVTGAGAPAYAFAGTVYTDSNRTAIAAGVTVTVSGMTPVVTDTGGNFYAFSPPTVTAGSTAHAGAQAMSSTLAAGGGGDCNSTGCHQQPGGTQQGIYK